MKKVLAWHFTDGMKLRDGRKLIVGKTYKHKGEMVMCDRGYHASIRLIDALGYAPGATLSRVECGGKVERGDDKLVCTERKVLWTIDATRLLHLFACAVAEKALKVAKVTDERSWNAIKVKRLWLDGKASNEELAAAGGAAWAAARDSARDAARDAACDAACDAAWDAACDAAWDAARAEQNKLLTSRVLAEHRKQGGK